jgi:uncharacterized protein YjiS (DUF1127 family)
MPSENRPRSAVAELLRRLAAWPFRVAAARATLKALAAMDRRELSDIGLTPSDLRDVSALPLDRDPTALLASRAHERRRDAHAPPTAPASDARAFRAEPAASPRGGPRTARALSKQA